jgi:hypothetical protein
MTTQSQSAITRPAVPVAFARQPFGLDVWRGAALEGASLAEIAAAVPDLPARFWSEGRICINGEAVPAERWHLIRPKTGGRPVAITMHLPLHGGGDGDSGKSVMALVATIALIAATISIGGGALAGAGGWFAAGSTSAKILAAGVALAGQLAISAVFAPAAQPTSLSQGDEKDLASASFEQNAAEKGGSLQHVVGTARVYPNLITLPLTELVGNDEFVEAGMALAGQHRMTDPRIGDALSDDLNDVTLEIREGFSDDDPVSLVTRQGYEETPQIILSDHIVQDAPDDSKLKDQASPTESLPFWHMQTTREAPDEIWLTLYWIEGFFDQSQSGSDYLIPIRLRIRQVGTSDWINLPEIHFKSHKQSLVRKMIKIRWGTAPSPLPSPPTAEGPVTAFRSVPVQDVASGPPIGGWTAHAYFGSGAINAADNVALYSDRAEIWLDAGTFPKAAYEVQIIKGLMVRESSFVPSTYALGGSVYDLFGYYLSSGAPSLFSSLGDKHYRVSLARFASVWNESPFAVDDGLAKIAVRVKNRRADRLSLVASAYVPDYEHGEWGRLVTTSNPAPHFRACMIGPLNRRPFKARQMDEESIITWRSYCQRNDLQVNAVLQGHSVADALQLMAAAGHATLRAMPYGVAFEYDRTGEDPIQIFSPRNSANYRFEKAFPTLPDGLLVTFLDETNAYRAKEIVVLADGASLDDPDLVLEAMQYDGITREDLVRMRARLDLRQVRYRATFRMIDTDVESIVCRRGSLVGLQHDVIDKRAGSALIRSVLTADGLVTGLRLDSAIPVTTEANLNDVADLSAVPDVTALGIRTGCAIRLNTGTGTVIVKEIANGTGDTDQVAFAAPFAIPDGLEPDCLVVSGRLGTEYRRMIVKDIAPDENLRASITMVDEAPQIHPLTA